MSSTEFTSFEDVARAKKVVPFSTVHKLLEQTEPVQQHVVLTNGMDRIRVTMPDDWNVGMKELDDSSVTSCKLHLEDQTYTLNKESVLTLLRRIGISERYALKTPGSLMEPHVNYWLVNDGVGRDQDDSVLIVTKDKYVVGITSPNHPVISNLVVLNEIEEFIKTRGLSGRVYVDPKITNNFTTTDFRLIMEDVAFEVKTKRDSSEEIDKWHFGIHVSNSLISTDSRPLTLSGFMMEEKSLAGIIPEFSSLIGYSRSNILDVADLRGWVGSTLEQIFDVLPVEAETVQDMPGYTFHGKVGALTTDLFKSMKIHRRVQEAALEYIMKTGDMSSYGIMVALSRSVSPLSELRLPPKTVSYIQKVCGTLPARASEVCDSCGRLHMHD